MKKLFVIMLLGIFMVSLSSAAWDFDNTYNYNEETKTAVIHNCDVYIPFFGCVNEGEILANLTLTWGDTTVARGIDQHVGTFTMQVTESGYDDTIFDALDLEDLKNGQVMTRGKQYKVKTYKNISVDDFETTCEDVWNATNNSYYPECITEEIGNHWEVQEEWTPISNPNFEFEVGIEYEVGVFVDVEEGDRGDWIPSLMGISISEWSSWTESLNVDISEFWDYNELSGDLIGLVNGINGTTVTATQGSDGIIGDSYTMVSGDVQVPTNSLLNWGNTTYSMNFWVYPTSASLGWLFQKGTSGDNPIQNIRMETDRTIGWYAEGTGDQTTIVYSSGTVTLNQWNMVTVVMDFTNKEVDFYLDGSHDVQRTYTESPGTIAPTQDLYIGSNAGASYFQGRMDETGIWGRELTSGEIGTNLWNSGNGNTYTAVFGTPPSVTLTSPANNSNLTSANIDFITTVTDDLQVSNVTLFIDGLANESNTSGVNGTYTFSKMISEGVHNWSILAIDNQSLENQSETRTFNLTIPPIFIDLLSPADASTHNIPLVNMSCTAYKDVGVTQLNLTIDGVTNISITNTSIAENLTISQDVNFSEGNYTWGCSAINPDTSAVSSNRTFEVLYSSPVINLFDPANDSTILINSTTFIFNASDVNGIDNISLYIDGVLNETNSSGFEGNYSFFRTLADGFYNWSVRASSVLGKVTNSTTWFFTLHTEIPVVNITAPSGIINYFKLGENETLVYNISEIGSNSSHFDSCWYVYRDEVLKEFDGDVFDSGTKFGWIYINDKDTQNFSSVYTGWEGASPWIRIYKDSLSKTGDYQSLALAGPEYNASTTWSMDLNDNGWHYYELQFTSIGAFNTNWIDMFKVIGPVSYAQDNISLNCSANTTSFTYINGANEITVFAEDEFGFIANDTSTWEYKVLEINQTYEEEILETFFNNFTVNIKTAASSITNPKFIYKDIENTATLHIIDSENFYLTSSVVTNTSLVGNNSFYWNITLDGTEISTSIQYQNVSEINFSICEGDNNITFLSFDFQDELTLDSLNATIRTSTFEYYIEDILAKKTYMYSTAENNSQYDFCFAPPFNVTTDYSISYYGDGYPERTFGTTLDLTNETTNVTLNLLSDASGLYATFKFIDATSKVGLSDVDVIIYEGSTIIIEKTTDDSGLISEWLNPNILYEVQYTKVGYEGGSQSHRPISTETINIEMVSDFLISSPSITNGLVAYYYPQLTGLDNDTNYDFGFYTSEGEEEIDTMKFSIYDEDRNLIYEAEKSGDGNMSQQSINTSQNSTLLGIYEINGTEGGYWRFYRTYYVTVITSTDYSLSQWGKSFNTYFPAEERTVLTNLIWYIVWFILMIAGFTFGYNGSYRSPEDYRNNVSVQTRSNTSVGMFFAFIISWIFCYFNLIPFPVPLDPVLIPKAWLSQFFIAVMFLVILIADVGSSLYKHNRRGT